MATEFTIKLVMQPGAGMPKPGAPFPGMPTPAGANKLTGALKKLGLAVGGLYIAKQGITQLKAHSTEMAQVGLMAGKTGEDLRMLGHDILDMSSKYGKSATDMRTAAYNVYSAQVPVNQALGVLEQSTKAAMAGNAGVTDSFNLMSSIIKGYGKDWSEVGDVSDHVFKIIEQGQTTMPELAASMGHVVPIANSLGVGLSELSGFYATFTGVTGDAAEVTTQLKSSMQAFTKPSEEMTKIAQDLGYATAEQIVQDKGLAVALQMVTGATDGTATEIGKLIPNARALPLVLAAVGGQSDVLTDKIGKMNDRFGATDNAVKNVKKSIGQRMSEMQEKFKNTLTRIMELAVPFLEAGMVLISGVFAVLTPLIEAFDSLPGFLKPIIISLGALVALQLKYNIVSKLSTFWTYAQVVALEVAEKAAKIYRIAVQLLTTSFGPLIIAVGGAIAIFLVWKASAEAARKSANKALTEENALMKASGENLDAQIENMRKLEEAKRGASVIDGKLRKKMEEDLAKFLGREVSWVRKASADEIKAQLDQYNAIKARQDRAAADQEKAAMSEQERLNDLIEQLKEYGIAFTATEDVISDIERAEKALADARQKRLDEQNEALKEWRAAEAQATEELARMDYEAGRTSLAQYTAHLTEKMNAIKGNSQQEILARLQVQKEIDDLNKEALEKDLAISALRTSMLIEMAEEERDKSVAIYGATLEQKLAAGDNYWNLREQQIRETAAKEEQTEEELALYLQQLGIERAAWEQEQRDADVAATEDAEAKKLQARKDAGSQAVSAVGSIAESITSIYDSEMQKQIEAIKARGLSEEEEQAKIAAVTAKYEKKKQQMAKIQKAVKVSQAISNTAVAATEALKLGPILGPIMAGVITAMGMAQVAAIMAQPYYRGGIIKKGQVGFIEGYRDEAVNIPLRGEGSFEEVARVQLIPELMRNMRGTDTLGKPVEPSRPAMKGGDIAMTNINNFNGAVLTRDVPAVIEWQTKGSKRAADKLIEAQKSLG